MDHSPSWSPDSRWLTWGQDLTNQQSAVVLHDLKEDKTHQVTSGFYNDDLPGFDPDGKYLYFRTTRNFNPIYSELDSTWIYANGTRMAVVPLTRDLPNPMAPKNDDEERTSISLGWLVHALLSVKARLARLITRRTAKRAPVRKSRPARKGRPGG